MNANDGQPDPADAVALAEEVALLVADLTPQEHRIFELVLDGTSTIDIYAARCRNTTALGKAIASLRSKRHIPIWRVFLKLSEMTCTNSGSKRL